MSNILNSVIRRITRWFSLFRTLLLILIFAWNNSDCALVIPLIRVAPVFTSNRTHHVRLKNSTFIDSILYILTCTQATDKRFSSCTVCVDPLHGTCRVVVLNPVQLLVSSVNLNCCISWKSHYIKCLRKLNPDTSNPM